MEEAEKEIVCSNNWCCKTFTLAKGEQDFYKREGLTEPKRCPDCRLKRKKKAEELRDK